MGSRTHEGEREHKEWKGQSEAAGMRAKGDDLLFDSGLHFFLLLLGTERRFIYMYNKAP